MARQTATTQDVPRPRTGRRCKQVAAALNVTTRTIHRWENAGNFPRGVKVGPNSTIYWDDEVEAWKASRGRRRPYTGG